MVVTLVCDGQTWTGWQSFSITKSMHQIQHSFQMTTTDRYQSGLEKWNVKGGSKIQVFIDGANQIFEGYVQKYSVNITADSHSITIAGESKAIDLVQCSHLGKYFWKNCSAESIIQEVVKPFGLETHISQKLEPIPKEGFRVAVDTTAYDILKKIAEQNGLLIFTDNHDLIRFGNDAPQWKTNYLTTGDYIEISTEHDIASIFSKLILKAQEKTYKSKEFKKRQRKEQVVNNDKLVRYRPLVVISDGKKRSQEKLKTYIDRRLNGNGVKASVTVKSPYDKNGHIWQLGSRLWLKEPAVDIDQELLVSNIEFSLSDSGFTTKLDLQVPETFTIVPPSPTSARRSSGIFSDLMEAFNEQ